MNSSDRVRLNLSISHALNDRIDRLVALTDAASRTEVIRRALAVYEHAVNRARSPVLDTLPQEEPSEAELPPQLLLEV